MATHSNIPSASSTANLGNPSSRSEVNSLPNVSPSVIGGAEPMKGREAVRPRSAGPRTARGKERSKFNALKHGLLSKAVLLKGESSADYLSLLNGLKEDRQPQGALENTLVENLAACLWRKRRFFQAETAEISEKMEFTEIDFMAEQRLEAWDSSRAAIGSGGLLKHTTNPRVVREAREILERIRAMVSADMLEGDSRLLKKLYGEDQDGGTPHGLRLLCEMYFVSAKQFRKQGNSSGDPEFKKIINGMIDEEMARLAKMEEALETLSRERIEYKSSAAVIPGQEVSDRLLRYETHLSREIDKILNQLERLQRMRRGQPAPPRIDVNIS